MNIFLSHLHTDLRTARLTRRGATHAPDAVPRGMHKSYPRMKQILLPDPQPLAQTLISALDSRSSGLEGDPNLPLSAADLGTLFGASLKKRPNCTSRNYPSGGGLYPVETYLITTACEIGPPTIYHYDPTRHALEALWDLPQIFNLKEIARKPEQLHLSGLIVFTAVWQRSSAKYGDLSYGHALLEAGHMSENILLVATALRLSARPYAGFDDARITELLDIDPLDEQPIHSVALCKKLEDSGKIPPMLE